MILALFVSGGSNSTLTRNMFLALRDQIDPTIAAISTLMILVTTVLFALSQLFGQEARTGAGRPAAPGQCGGQWRVAEGTLLAAAQAERKHAAEREQELLWLALGPLLRRTPRSAPMVERAAGCESP